VQQPTHFTDRRWVQYVLLVGVSLAVLSPAFARQPKDDFPLSPYEMFAEKKDENTTVTQAVAILPDGREEVLPPRLFGTDEVLQARAMLARAARGNKQSANELCASLATAAAREARWQTLKEVQIRTVTFESIKYFEDPAAPPLKKRLHARCAARRS